MPSALIYSIALLPAQYDNDWLLHRYADKLRELRLRALKSNLESFSSSFAQEKQEPHEFWTNRIADSKARHYVAIRHNADSREDAIIEGAETTLQSEWVGGLVRLGPKIVDRCSFSNESSWHDETDRANLENARGAAYHLGGFYVAPEARRQGLGARLIRAALDTIAADCQIAKWSEAICTVGTEHSNTNPQRLFARMGFSNVATRNIQQNDGRHVTEIVWRQEFFFPE